MFICCADGLAMMQGAGSVEAEIAYDCYSNTSISI
jgi:hypothetical protein